MDPDAALEELRRLVALILDEDRQSVRFAPSKELAESFAALDGWLSGGGFPPNDWVNRPPTREDVGLDARS